MREIKVAMLSYHTCPLATLGGKDTGGMNVYVRELTRRLGEMDVHVDVFTRSQDEHVPHVLHDLGYGNRVVHIPSGPELPLPKPELASYLPQFVQGIQLFAESKGIHYDVIHSHYWMSGLAANQLSQAWGTPIVHMFHTLGEMKNRVAQSESEKEGAYRLDGERDVIAGAAKLVAATLAEQSQLEFLYNAPTRKIVVIPPGVDLCHFYPIPKDEALDFIGCPPCEKVLLFVGRIEALKGLDVLLKAISILRDRRRSECPEFCLSVIGGDPLVDPVHMSSEMTRLQTLRSEYGLQDFVTLLGKKSQDTLPYYYSAAEAVIVPSHYESFGMVALEAMACGTPVVASEVGGLAYLVQDGRTGFTVPVGDPKALADRLECLLTNPELRNQMGARAAEQARLYSWDHIARRVIATYHSVLDGEL
jgi:D-inositol-3-phosphate glycosyltransferase